jgi:Sigma-70 region 2
VGTVVEAQVPAGARTASDTSARTTPWLGVASSPDALFHAHYSRLVEAIAAASGDDDGAADAVQEAFVQLWRHWDEVRLYYKDPVGWVRRVAINRAYVVTVRGDKVSHMHVESPADGGIPAALEQLGVEVPAMQRSLAVPVTCGQRGR